MGIWRVIGSSQLHNLAARSTLVFNSTPSGNKLACISSYKLQWGLAFSQRGCIVKGEGQRTKKHTLAGQSNCNDHY
eukprot:1158101-Pelagomonas_calceolata.AAC.15